MPNLYMLLIGCSPPGRNIEQHDVYFGIGENLRDVIPYAVDFWPGGGKIHFDAWRKVHKVNEFEVTVITGSQPQNTYQLFFLNLGGYKPDEFEEFHYKMIVAAKDKSEAIRIAKQTAFYKHTGFKGAPSHIDDKYGIDVDDVYAVSDILDPHMKGQYFISVQPAPINLYEDEIHLGYFRIDKVNQWAAE
ncbi:DUF1543 domain-containing protein [Pollutibacter soli]|uniref:DUF1543 domain-containing protein n=1 Tax=Pollutibacter soli TaxID=3034157 RepID=UPI003013ACBD